MRLSRISAAAGQIWLALAVLVLLPTSNVLMLTSPAFVSLQYSQPGFPPAERYSASDRLALAQETVRWLNSSAGIDGLAALQHRGEPVYNPRELRHMWDVKVVLDGLRWAWRAAALTCLVALGLAAWRRGWRRPLARSAFWGSAVLVAALLGILISALLSFDWFFVRFHQIFFEGETWTFAYEDSLIQFYPIQFWMAATFILGAATLMEGMLVGALSSVYLARTRGRS